MTMGNLKIGTRLSAGFGIVSILLLVVAGIGLNSNLRTNADMDAITHDGIPKISATDNLVVAVLQGARRMGNSLFMSDGDKIQEEIAAIKKGKLERQKYLESLDKMALSPEGRKLFDAVVQAGRADAGTEDSLIRRIEAGSAEMAKIDLIDIGLPL